MTQPLLFDPGCPGAVCVAVSREVRPQRSIKLLFYADSESMTAASRPGNSERSAKTRSTEAPDRKIYSVEAKRTTSRSSRWLYDWSAGAAEDFEDQQCSIF
jgi:hypothetical protein